MADEVDPFEAAFAAIAAEDAKGTDKKPASPTPSVASAENEATVAAVAPVAGEAQPETEKPNEATESTFEVPAKTPDELVAEAAAAVAAAKSPEEKTAAEALKAQADAAKAEADAAKAKADADAAAAAEQQAQADFVKRLFTTVKDVAPQPQTETQPQAQPQPLVTKEESEFLAQYEKDFPEVARAEFIRRRAEYNQLLQYVFNQIATELKPVVETVAVIAQRTHLGDLHTAVQDYDSIRDQVINWVGQQPAYLKSAYEHVVQEGSPEEVVDLVNRWRAATGQKTAIATAPAVKTPKEPTEAARAAAAALAPVHTKRTGAVATQPTTFDDAFTQFAREG